MNSESGASEQQTRGANDPRLLASDAEDLRIWVDAGSRLSALESIVRAMPEDLSWLDPDDAALRQAVEYVDRQVAAGMSALGWTGRSVGRVLMRNVAERVQANKYPDCTLEISAEWLRRWVRKHRSPDTVIHTWVHESVHARRPFTVRQAGVELKVPGYEEGLAEGIAGLTVRSQAHMEPIVGGYALYVRSYESLASVLGVSAEDIWRSLWQYRVGEVRANFVDVVERYWYNLTGKRLSEREKRNLLWKADSLFRSANQFEGANAGWSDESLARWWRSALPEMPESR